MFYISSRGSSANTWVAETLNCFSGIVCFNSSRSFPPLPPGKTYPNHYWVSEISPEKYIESLKIVESCCRFKIKFGSIHGYHGTLIKDSCEKNNGNFFYITRDPLERIHSVFIYNLSNGIYYNKIENEKIFEHVINSFNNNEKLADYKTSKKNLNFFKNSKLHKIFYKKFIRNNNYLYEKIKNYKLNKKNLENKKNILKGFKNEKGYLINLFKSLCEDFFYKEKQLLNECRDDQGLKMEELVKSKDYFARYLLKKIDDENFLKNKKTLDALDFTKSKRVGIHRKIPLKSKRIWQFLPKILKEIYIESFERNKIDAVCKKFNYDYSFLS